MSKKDSIAKGGSSVAIARLLGMVLSFLLFLVLARHSAEDAGVFRTVVTYLVIAEMLGMLGMHRWLSTEIADGGKQQWPLFLASNVVVFVVSLIMIVIYLSVAASGIYSVDVNVGLQLAALSMIPSGIYQCVQSAMIGIGKTHSVGKYNGVEYAVRCSISIGLIYFGFPVVYVIGVFVLTRWGVALVGFYQLSKFLDADRWISRKSELMHVLSDAPKFIVITISFLAVRNAGLVLIPALVGDAENAFFGVAYQLFDMILLIPSVLAITSNHVFVSKANHSDVALRRVSTQLLSITSLALFPCIAITAAFSQNFLIFLYGEDYVIARYTLIFLMLASGFSMIDQVLSQVMTSRKEYKKDMFSIIAGGVTTVLLTVMLTMMYGAVGAAIALMFAMFVTVLVRLVFLKRVFTIKLLLLSTWRPGLSAFIIFCLSYLTLEMNVIPTLEHAKYIWIPVVPIVLALYVGIVYSMGGISIAKRTRIKQFLFDK